MALSFEDLEKLPADVKIDLGDGKTITLGEMRDVARSHAEETINKRIADLTPREQKVADRERMVEEEARKVRETMTLLATNPPPPPNNNPPPPGATPPPLGYTQVQWDALNADPYMRPLIGALSQLAEETATLKKKLEDGVATQKEKEELARQNQENAWINHQLDQLSTTDGRYKDPQERASLLTFAQDVLKRRDLTAIHKARNYDTAVADAEKTGYERGLKEGKGTAPVPSVIHGTRVAPVVAPPEKLPKTFAEFSDAAANDQSLINEIREAASQPPPQQQ